jgi:hypothetical protein
MKKIFKCLFLLSLIMSLSSCGREKLTPLYQSVTTNQLRNEQPLNFSYELDETQIDEYAKNTGKFPLFGRLFQAIAVVLANTAISGSGHELELEAVDVDLSSLSEINFDLIDYIDLSSLVVSVRNAKNKDSLKFINKLEILAKLENPVEGLAVDKHGYSRLIYYDSGADSLLCDEKCLKLNIVQVNWKELLRTNKIVHLQPKLTVNSVPASTMKLAGSIDFSVKFNLGF